MNVTPFRPRKAWDTHCVFARIKDLEQLTTDRQLGELLGFSQPGIAGQRNRNTLPTSALIEYAAARDVSLDWLLRGVGSPRLVDLVSADSMPLRSALREAGIDFDTAARVAQEGARERLLQLLRLAGWRGDAAELAAPGRKVPPPLHVPRTDDPPAGYIPTTSAGDSA